MARKSPICFVRNVSLAERLEAYSMPEPNSGCRLWLGGERNGYGRVPKARGSLEKRGAHVVAWELHNRRPVPPGLDVLHKCDVTFCIEGTHLFTGTHQDNMADKVAKGRQSRMQGSDHPAAKLDEEKIRRILSMPDQKGRAIAKEYDVSESTISLIRRRKIWGHVQ